MTWFKKQTKGVAIVEMLVGVAILLLVLSGFITSQVLYTRSVVAGVSQVKAIFLLEEGVEAVRLLRDNGWNTNVSPLSTSQTYYLSFENSAWTSTTTPVYVDTFERTFILEDVYRDANDNIAVSGTLDTGIKKLTVFVSWPEKNATSTRSLITYIADIFDN